MKKFILAAAALTVAVMGFGGLKASTTYANPTAVYVINTNVGASLAGITPAAFDTAMGTAAGRATISSSFAAMQTASGGQISGDMPNAGQDWVVVVTDDPTATSLVSPTGKGLTCTPVCTNVGVAPDATDKMAVFHVTAAGTFTGGAVTAIQAPTNVSVDSMALTLVGAAHDIQLTASKATVQEGATACAIAASQAAPTNGAGTAVYTDISGKALVGYMPTFKTSAASTMVVGNTAGTLTAGGSQQLTTMVQADGTTIGAVDSYCGVAAGTATLSAAPTATEIAGTPAGFARTASITVTGVPAAVTLTASPAAIACDGTATSTVTAKVVDSKGNDVVDGTNVNFSVVALGTANPINATTKAGSASSTITPLSGGTAGVVVLVTSGSAQASMRIDCSLPVATPTSSAPAASPTPGTGIVGPNTGTGGYLGQDGSAGFPMWTLVALVLGSLVLVGGGMVTRRSGK